MSLCIIKPCLGVNLFAADESGIQAGARTPRSRSLEMRSVVRKVQEERTTRRVYTDLFAREAMLRAPG